MTMKTTMKNLYLYYTIEDGMMEKIEENNEEKISTIALSNGSNSTTGNSNPAFPTSSCRFLSFTNFFPLESDPISKNRITRGIER